jgi:hypothetical protein
VFIPVIPGQIEDQFLVGHPVEADPVRFGDSFEILHFIPAVAPFPPEDIIPKVEQPEFMTLKLFPQLKEIKKMDSVGFESAIKRFSELFLFVHKFQNKLFHKQKTNYYR